MRTGSTSRSRICWAGVRTARHRSVEPHPAPHPAAQAQPSDVFDDATQEGSRAVVTGVGHELLGRAFLEDDALVEHDEPVRGPGESHLAVTTIIVMPSSTSSPGLFREPTGSPWTIQAVIDMIRAEAHRRNQRS